MKVFVFVAFILISSWFSIFTSSDFLVSYPSIILRSWFDLSKPTEFTSSSWSTFFLSSSIDLRAPDLCFRWAFCFLVPLSRCGSFNWLLFLLLISIIGRYGSCPVGEGDWRSDTRELFRARRVFWECTWLSMWLPKSLSWFKAVRTKGSMPRLVRRSTMYFFCWACTGSF